MLSTSNQIVAVIEVDVGRDFFPLLFCLFVCLFTCILLPLFFFFCCHWCYFWFLDCILLIWTYLGLILGTIVAEWKFVTFDRSLKCVPQFVVMNTVFSLMFTTTLCRERFTQKAFKGIWIIKKFFSENLIVFLAESCITVWVSIKMKFFGSKKEKFIILVLLLLSWI